MATNLRSATISDVRLSGTWGDDTGALPVDEPSKAISPVLAHRERATLEDFKPTFRESRECFRRISVVTLCCDALSGAEVGMGARGWSAVPSFGVLDDVQRQ
jgi:hypothetical protein